MSRQKLRITREETLKICRGIAMIVVTKQRAEERKNVVTSKPSIVTKASKSSMQESKVCHGKVSYVSTNPLEINSVTQEECRDI